MRDFSNLVEAINILKKEGYTEDFDLESDCICCSSNKLRLNPDQFHIDEYFRFEGTSSPDDSSILYAISSDSLNIKGLMINAYGIYADDITAEMVNKLDIR